MFHILHVASVMNSIKVKINTVKLMGSDVST